jgi:hypothetical protein
VELGTRPGPVTKIRYRWVCERPVDLILNLVTLSGVTICIYPAEPMDTWTAPSVTFEILTSSSHCLFGKGCILCKIRIFLLFIRCFNVAHHHTPVSSRTSRGYVHGHVRPLDTKNITFVSERRWGPGDALFDDVLTRKTEVGPGANLWLSFRILNIFTIVVEPQHLSLALQSVLIILVAVKNV